MQPPVITPPCRYWWQISLRTLFIVVTLCAIGTAGYVRQTRVLRTWEYHRGQVRQCDDTQAIWNRVSFDIPEIERLTMQYRHEFHSQRAAECEYALWRPWVAVPSLQSPRTPLRLSVEP